MSDGAKIEVPVEVLRVALDVMVSSLDFGSGFWDQEDTEAARTIAVLLGICPAQVTPSNVKGNYPKCEHHDAGYGGCRADDAWRR